MTFKVAATSSPYFARATTAPMARSAWAQSGRPESHFDAASIPSSRAEVTLSMAHHRESSTTRGPGELPHGVAEGVVACEHRVGAEVEVEGHERSVLRVASPD